ncbi:MAG: riboflavin kinase/FMN adenylyltransferase [Alteromonadaceae bacterium]|jgi:riboflavin kinase/FMN adenylyltransferase
MELIRGIHNIKPHHRGTVLTIGNFDGVHQGHQGVIEGTIKQAKALNVTSTVMLFEPQPMELFLKDKAPARLYRLRDKYLQLRRLGVDQLLCVKFDHAFASMDAMTFIVQLLVEKLNLRHLIVGDDFCFGKNRLGNFAMLVEAGQKYGFEVTDTDSYRLENCRISSTAIRQALLDGHFDQVKQMLGHPFSISGRVSHGDKKGRTIGFPTANVALKRGVSPVDGVFAVRVTTDRGEFEGVANIGHRPTVSGVVPLLEVHLFDFAQQIYGQQIEVVLEHKIRDEHKFESFEALKEQITRDVLHAKQFFA